MKKFAISVVAIIAALAIVAPALAAPELDITGTYRVRGFFDSNVSLNSDYDDSSAWYDMRLRVRPSLKVTDNLTLHARFDLLDDVRWGTALNSYDQGRGVDFDRMWMAIMTDYGKIEVGRMTGSVFGTDFMNNSSNADRIKYTIKLDEIVVGAVYEKAGEVDSYFTTSDSDYDKYFIFANYSSEMITGGMLVGYYNDKGSSDNVSVARGNLDPFAWNAALPVQGPVTAQPFDREFWFLNPYGILKIDDITVTGELFYQIGKFQEYDHNQYSDINVYPAGCKNAGGKLKDWDLDAWAWNLEGAYEMGPFNFQLGYAWMQGLGEIDRCKTDKWTTAGSLFDDWQKLWILTGGEDVNLYEQGTGPIGGLGGYWGNLASSAPNGQNMGLNGAKIFYVGAGFKPIENLSLNILYGNAKAEAPINDKLSKDYGSEYDFTLVWDIMDNLQYKFIAAYLDAGDFFKGAKNAINPVNGTMLPYVKDLENNYSLFHQLELSF